MTGVARNDDRHTREEGLDHTEAERLVLLSIYAPGSPSREHDTWIDGRTRLMKAAFLAKQKFEEELSESLNVPFVAGKYGPFSKQVLDAIESLEREGLLEVEELEEAGRHKLTRDGVAVARTYWDQLPEEHQELLSWIKRRHVAQSLDRLLSFVYKRYPHMTGNSEIADEYLA